MVGRRPEALSATDAERSELKSLVARPKTAQALADRARIILACADDLENKMSLGNSECVRIRLANGAEKTALIRNWLAKRPRWHVHLTRPAALG